MHRVSALVFGVFFVSLALSSVAQTFSSSNLPIVIVKTNGMSIVDEPKVIVDFGIIDNGPGNRNAITDAHNGYQGKAAMEIRGSSSQMFPKKQYGVELVDANGLEIEASLLGLPAESDWILFAPYNDKTLMRDVLAYKLGSSLGNYTPRTRYCELVMDGQYRGVYVLMERIKRDDNRVDIDRLSNTENSGDDLTGGYIIKIDKRTGDLDPGWNSATPPPGRVGQQVINFLYEYPRPSDITAQQKQYIQKFIDDFETLLKSDKYRDPINGYASVIDVDSFINFLIINEVSKNIDGYRLSTFLHKQKNSDGGKLVMGPLWDFNLGFGNADYCDGWKADGLALWFNSICPKDTWLIPFWWNRLMQDVSFNKKLASRWTSLRAGAFSDTRIHKYVDSVALVLDESQQRNFQTWPVMGRYVWPNFFIGNTYAQEVAWLKSWITQRNAWLDNYFGGLVTAADEQADQQLQIVPNPTRGHFQLSVNNGVTAQVLKVVLIDMTGRELSQQITGSGEAVAFGHALAAGIYWCKIIADGQILFQGKIIKH